MDCGRAVAAHFDRRDRVRTAVRHRLGWLLARKDFCGKTLLDGIIYLPLVLPPVVTGYLLLISFGRSGPIGAFLADNFGLVFSFRWTGAALACGVMGFPLMVRPIRLALEAIDRRLEDAAATLGANRLWCFLPVTLPLALPGVIAGADAVLSPGRSVNSAPPSPSSPTFPAKRRRSPPRSTPCCRFPAAKPWRYALVLIAIVLALGALIASEWFARRAGMRFQGE